MSFHGGLIGVVSAIVLYARRQGIVVLILTDLIALVTPIGLFFGRIANFINGELYGRISDVPWAMVFPRGGPAPRHPSQLYEAALEGVVLFAVLYALDRVWSLRARPGVLAGAFCIGYGILRAFVELFRAPDDFLGFLWGGLTMGQLLSLPLAAVGIWLIWRAKPLTKSAAQ
jgi:phosphatidylglycerol:prolipoprotein diacylglycerol transferase